VKLSRGTVAAIFISFGGLALVLGTSFGNVSILGIALSLAASVIYATFIVLGNRAVEDVNPAVMCTFVSLFTIVTLFPLAMINGGLGLPSTLKGWFVTAGCGVVGSTIPFVAFFAGITVVGATTASIIANAEPVTAVILSALLFSQHLTGMQLLGGVLILAGGTIAVLAKKRIVKGASP
jgi:drug/metabolite transporter (DMT)-like permease